MAKIDVKGASVTVLNPAFNYGGFAAIASQADAWRLKGMGT